MSDARKALHELVDQAPEEALPRLRAWLTRLVSPPEPSEGSGLITFFPTEPGTTDPEATSVAERERRERLIAEADLAGTSGSIEQGILRALERLGLRPESLGRPRMARKPDLVKIHCRTRRFGPWIMKRRDAQSPRSVPVCTDRGGRMDESTPVADDRIPA
jgi:hypothetical protein